MCLTNILTAFYILFVTLHIVYLQTMQYVNFHLTCLETLSNCYLGQMKILVLFNLHPTFKYFFDFSHLNLNIIFSINYSD